MKVICNGIPKSGTHALLKAVQLLGVTDTDHEHLAYSSPLHDKHILIIRNPRDVLISWCRWTYKQVTQGFIIGAMAEFVQHYNDYKPWLTDADTLVIKFEDLISDNGVTIQQIATYLDVPYLTDAYANLPGLTRTWTGNYSDWTEHWTQDIEDAWQAVGGANVEQDYGYVSSF